MRWMILVLLLLSGCARPWEGVIVRQTWQAFETCKRETGVTAARIDWMAPDGRFVLWTPDQASLAKMKQCMTSVVGTRWP